MSAGGVSHGSDSCTICFVGTCNLRVKVFSTIVRIDTEREVNIVERIRGF